MLTSNIVLTDYLAACACIVASKDACEIAGNLKGGYNAMSGKTILFKEIFQACLAVVLLLITILA